MDGNKFTPADFRKELTKVMPGYSWTVHKSNTEAWLKATGIQSSGFNRLSTLVVIRNAYGDPFYEVKSSGFGKNSPWLYSNTDSTLARALRGLQNYYEMQANKYRSHAASLQLGRTVLGGAK